MELGTYITTIHNPESVVEIYLNQQHQRVTEIKSLNGNRTKYYEYALDKYLHQVQGFKGVDEKLRQLTIGQSQPA